MEEIHIITEEKQAAFLSWLAAGEKEEATIKKYGHDVRALSLWLDGSEATKEKVTEYKRYLHEVKGREATGVNAAIAAINSFFSFTEWVIKLKPLKIQKQTFKAKEKELTKAEYDRLLTAAGTKGKKRLNLIMQTICSTGIRVSELEFITVEAVSFGEVTVTNKGKTRTVFIPKELKPLLLNYAKGKGISSGYIFITKNGKPVNRSNIWADMKKLCEEAGVAASKVFPHNLRALFARVFYGIDKDIMRLADILGHSDVNTTRIYLMESGENHRRRVNSLGLVMKNITEYRFCDTNLQ